MASCAVLATACASTPQDAGPRVSEASSTTAPTPTVGRVDDRRCDTPPSRGTVTRPQGPLRLTDGEVVVSVRRLPAAQAPDRTPGESGPSDDVVCLRYPHRGPPDPVLPVDSVVLTFRDSGSDGVVVEMPLTDLVARPRLTAQVGVVVDGRHYQASTCSLETTDLSETRAAGVFTCPSAVLDETNPFAPSDDIAPSDRSPEPSPDPGIAPPPTAVPTPVPSATLTGWYRLQG